MVFQKGKFIEVEITNLAFGGMGIAKIDGFPIFVDRAIPKDKAVVKIVKKKKNYAEAVLVDLIEPSPIRAVSECSYADYCGGCRWQSLPYSEQLKYKKEHVIESLQHIGQLREILVRDVIPSKNIFEFRNKMEFSCSNSRWLTPHELLNSGIKKDFGLGLHVPGTFDKVIDIKKCLIQPDIGNQILGDIRDYIKASDTAAYNLKTHEGFWRFVMLRNSAAFGTWMVNIITKYENDDLLIPLAQKLMEKYPITSFINNITSKKASIAVGDYEKVIAGERCIREKLGEFLFEISANSFFQTNTKGAETLYSVVSKYLSISDKKYHKNGNDNIESNTIEKKKNIIDLYSGTGTIPIWLSKHAKKVIGIEIVESAVKDAKKNARLNSIENCQFYAGDIKDILSLSLINSFFDNPPNTISNKLHGSFVAVIDPPRAGMHKDVVEKIIELAPEKIIYVSCNPTTLARDLAMLSSKYNIIEVQPVDMFPHTFHIESVAFLEFKTI